MKLTTCTLIVFLSFFISTAWACGGSGCYYEDSSGDNRCGEYTCTTDRYTSPSICDSSCSDKCDLLCKNNNFNYRGCGDNCVMP